MGGHPLQTGKVGGNIILLFLRSWESLEISSQPGLSSQLKHGSGGGFSHPDSSLQEKAFPKHFRAASTGSRSREPGRSQRGAQIKQSLSPLLPKPAKELAGSMDSAGSCRAAGAEAAGEGWESSAWSCSDIREPSSEFWDGGNAAAARAKLGEGAGGTCSPKGGGSGPSSPWAMPLKGSLRRDPINQHNHAACPLRAVPTLGHSPRVCVPTP